MPSSLDVAWSSSRSAQISSPVEVACRGRKSVLVQVARVLQRKPLSPSLRHQGIDMYTSHLLQQKRMRSQLAESVPEGHTRARLRHLPVPRLPRVLGPRSWPTQQALCCSSWGRSRQRFTSSWSSASHRCKARGSDRCPCLAGDRLTWFRFCRVTR